MSLHAGSSKQVLHFSNEDSHNRSHSQVAHHLLIPDALAEADLVSADDLGMPFNETLQSLRSTVIVNIKPSSGFLRYIAYPLMTLTKYKVRFAGILNACPIRREPQMYKEILKKKKNWRNDVSSITEVIDQLTSVGLPSSTTVVRSRRQVKTLRELLVLPFRVVMAPLSAARSVWESTEAIRQPFNATELMKIQSALIRMNRNSTVRTSLSPPT